MYTAGQLAKLCRISKDTLFLYEKKGLLKPAYISDNGYRYYSTDNFYQLDMILVLRSSGSSLHEIKAYLDNLSSANYIELLKEKIHYIEDEQRRLNLLKSKLYDSLNLTRDGMTAPLGNAHIEYQDVQYLLIKKAYNNVGGSPIVTAFSDLVNECLSLGFAPGYHIGVFVSKERLENQNYSPDYCFTTYPKLIDNVDFFVKPAGNYATFIHKGPHEHLPASYEMLMEYIENNQLKITGNSYEQTLIGWFNGSGKNDYITKISINIE